MPPISQSIVSLGSSRFASSAAAAVTILKVEPGSKTSVSVRFFHCSRLDSWKLLGSKAGTVAMANTAPLSGSRITPIARAAR